MAADYASQASQIYDPQLAGEQATLKAEQATTDAGFTGETAAASDAYNAALKTLGDTEATGEARNNFNAATHGLSSSGLVANANRLTYGKYQEGVATTAQTRATKLADIAGRKQAADQGYTDKMGALASKYAGLKADYIAKNQNADAAAAAKFQQSQELAAERAALRGPSAASQKQSAYSDLQDSINAYIQDLPKISKPGYSEDVAIPNLVKAFAGQISESEIKSLYYNSRKAAGLG